MTSILFQHQHGVSILLATVQSRGNRKLEAYATEGHRMILVEELAK